MHQARVETPDSTPQHNAADASCLSFTWLRASLRNGFCPTRTVGYSTHSAGAVSAMQPSTSCFQILSRLPDPLTQITQTGLQIIHPDHPISYSAVQYNNLDLLTPYIKKACTR